MLKRLLLIGALVFVSALKSQARLGWTQEQCDAHYGSEIIMMGQPRPNTHYWKAGGYTIACHFKDGVANFIIYFSHAPFTVEKGLQLMKENAAGNWERVDGKPDFVIWSKNREILYHGSIGFTKSAQQFSVSISQGEFWR